MVVRGVGRDLGMTIGHNLVILCPIWTNEHLLFSSRSSKVRHHFTTGDFVNCARKWQFGQFPRKCQKTAAAMIGLFMVRQMRAKSQFILVRSWGDFSTQVEEYPLQQRTRTGFLASVP